MIDMKSNKCKRCGCNVWEAIFCDNCLEAEREDYESRQWEATHNMDD